MKRVLLKKKLYFAVSVIAICIALASFVFGIFINKNSKEKAVAVNSYTNSIEFINGLVDNKLYQTTYSMMEKYPLSAENQTNSNFCWIYASLKTLESSLMVQKGEYHNFSEMGSAYLYFTKITQNLDDGLKLIDITGNFVNFNILATTYGLVYENSFSNDLYFDINESNYENYSYVYDYVDTTIMQNIVPINFSDESNFVSFDVQTKIQVMKEYILNYGGLFAGIEKGIISNTNSTYVRTDERADSEYDGYISTAHAVCLVGWNQNRNAFLALNSWGASYDLFWIPYEYSYIYTDLHGYICNDLQNLALTNTNTTAGGEDGFAKKFNSKFNDQSNLFVYGEEIKLEYQVSDVSDFDNVFVYIYKGTENVTNQFSIEFFDDDLRIQISGNNVENLNDGYLIQFYDYETLIGFKDFYVFTGNEVSYIQLFEKNRDVTRDSVLFHNNFASGIYTQTYYVYNDENNDYLLELYLPRFNSYTKTNVITISTEVYEIVDGSLNINNTIWTTIDTDTGINSNYLRIKISNLTDMNEGKTFLVRFGLASRITQAQTSYDFIFHIGSVDGTITNLSHRIVYELDGGKNDILNINRYPKYEIEDAEKIQNYKLLLPTKYNSTFIGWYLDPSFTVEITEINANISTLLGKTTLYDENMHIVGYYSNLLSKQYSDDIVIYAKWENVDVEYFDIDFGIEKIISHEGVTRNYSGQKIIYGDSVVLQLTFTPYTENLTTYKYISKYEYSFKNKLVESDYLNENGDIIEFENLYRDDNLVCGSYTINVKVIMVISHQFSVEKEVELTYQINPKNDIVVIFDTNTLRYTYDKLSHLPVVSFGGIYEEDLPSFAYTFDKGAVTDAGEYTFNIKSINNSNYELSGNTSANLTIFTKAISIAFSNTEKVYNGNYQFPDYSVSGTIDDEYVNVMFAEKGTGARLEMKNVGEYRVSVSGINNMNYHFEGVLDCVFKITKAQITVNLIGPENGVRFTVAPSTRRTLDEYSVKVEIVGDLYDSEDSLAIEYSTNGLTATSGGDYVIRGYLRETNYINSNYDITFNDGIYKILGYYYVYYTLPNGETYKETVNEGENPVGITSDIYKAPMFGKLEYDKELVGNGLTDLTVKVTVKSYGWAIWLVVGVLFILILYFVITRKERKNKTR